LGHIDYIRHPIREPEYVHELVDAMAIAAGHSPQFLAGDFSNAVIHKVPVGTSRQDLLDEIEAAPLSRNSGLPSR
jgi:hypothetical protein